MKWLAIINPHANHHTAEQVRFFQETLEKYLQADCVVTRYPEHATEIVRQNRQYEGVVAVGGDGTISEVVNGLDLDRQSLGVIPAGTGNGLAFDLGLQTVGIALKALYRPHFDHLDMVRIHYRTGQEWHERWMFSIAAVGYLAATTEKGDLPLKRFGSCCYVLAAIAQCFCQLEFAVRLRIDDGPWQDLSLTTLIVQDGQHAGPFRLFPEASLTDGRLDLLYGRHNAIGQLKDDVGILLQKEFLRQATRRQARVVEAELREPATLTIDGEVFRGVDCIRFEIVPRKLRCCTGREQAVQFSRNGFAESTKTDGALLRTTNKEEESGTGNGRVRANCD